MLQQTDCTLEIRSNPEQLESIQDSLKVDIQPLYTIEDQGPDYLILNFPWPSRAPLFQIRDLSEGHAGTTFLLTCYGASQGFRSTAVIENGEILEMCQRKWGFGGEESFEYTHPMVDIFSEYRTEAYASQRAKRNGINSLVQKLIDSVPLTTTGPLMPGCV